MLKCMLADHKPPGTVDLVVVLLLNLCQFVSVNRGFGYVGMSNMKYYSFKKILGYNSKFNFVIGARGLGKTYGAKEFVIKRAIRNGDQFIYLRRYSTELKGRGTFFADIAHAFPNHDFRVNGQLAEMASASSRNDKKREWQTIGYFAQLSNALTQKSVAYPNVKTIIYDEFIIDKGLIQYLPNEAKAFLDFYSTVDRWKDKTRVLFLANSVSLTNPYFIEWNIKPDQLGEFVRLADGFIACHFAESAEFATAVYQTAFGKFIKGTEYADFAVESEFKDGHARMLGIKPSAAEHYANIETKGGRFSVWVDYLGPIYYIQEKCPNSGINFTLLPEFMDSGKVFLQYSDQFMQMLRAAFRNGRISFDGPRSRNTFIEVFRRG